MKKIISLILSVLLFLTGCSTSTNNYDEEINAFNNFLDEVFVNEMESSIINTYFTLNDYETYNIEKPEVTLGKIDYSDDDVKQINDTYDELKKFNRMHLTKEQQNYYDNLRFKLELSLEDLKFEDFNSLFRPSSGIISILSTNLMEYKFKNQERIDDYLILLKDMPRIINDSINYVKPLVEKGMFLNDFTIDKTIESIEKMIENIDNNALIITFNDRINKCDFIEDKDAYIDENKNIVINEIIPSLISAKDALISFKGSNKYLTGIGSYPNGQTYYEHLFKSKTGSDLTPSQALEDLASYIDDVFMDIAVISMDNQPAFNEYIDLNFEAQDPRTIIDNFIYLTPNYFPKGPDVEYEVSFLDPSVADDFVSAYYLVPEFDNIQDNVVRINGKYNEQDPSGMYNTLAHEAYPGHMYQKTYYYNTNPHPIVTILDNICYSEGWAMYTSLYGYDMLDLKYEETKVLLKSDIRLNYALSGLVDIAVNYFGKSVEDIEDLFESIGLEPSQVTSIYESVIDEPGQILPYAIGIMTFDNYFKEASNKIENFDIVDFNKMLLKDGATIFRVLDKNVDSYIKEHK